MERRIDFKELRKLLWKATERGWLFLSSEGEPWSWNRKRNVFSRNTWDDEMCEHFTQTYNPDGHICILRENSLEFYNNEHDLDLSRTEKYGWYYCRYRFRVVEPVDLDNYINQ